MHIRVVAPIRGGGDFPCMTCSGCVIFFGSNLELDPNVILTLFHMGGGTDSALLQIIFFITSIRGAAEPRNLVTFPKI